MLEDFAASYGSRLADGFGVLLRSCSNVLNYVREMM